jgi:hypothetical protein
MIFSLRRVIKYIFSFKERIHLLEYILSPVFRELCSIKGMLRAKYPPPISNVEHLILRLARMQMLSHRPSPTQGPKQTLKDKH